MKRNYRRWAVGTPPLQNIARRDQPSKPAEASGPLVEAVSGYAGSIPAGGIHQTEQAMNHDPTNYGTDPDALEPGLFCGLVFLAGVCFVIGSVLL